MVMQTSIAIILTTGLSTLILAAAANARKEELGDVLERLDRNEGKSSAAFIPDVESISEYVNDDGVIQITLLDQ